MESTPLPISGPNNASEFCPSCGELVDSLDDLTGWCITCTSTAKFATNVTSTASLFKGSTGAAVAFAADKSTVAVVTAKLEIALNANAERVEYYITQGDGTTVKQALKLAQQDRPTCIVCGNEMPHAGRKSMICRKQPECRRIYRRYRWLYAERGLSKTEAFAQILEELAGN
jgi:predicted amidophosphoribosyltransferase